MSKIGIFFGSTTGNTEMVAEKLRDAIGEENATLVDIQDASPEDMENYEILLLGIPTWDIGELQEDWEDFVKDIEKGKVNLKGKKFGMFGVGDQEGYPDTFGDAIGMVYDIVVENGGVPIGDKWPLDTYEFEESKGEKNGYFVGLMTDEDNQSELTDERISKYVEMIRSDLEID